MQKLNNNENIFAQRDCLSQEELIGYAKGTLSKKEKHYVEKHLLDCELCSDALEGTLYLNNHKNPQTVYDDLILRMGKRNFITKKNNNTWYVAAAAVVAIFLLSGIYFQFIRNSQNLKSNYADIPTKKEKIKTVAPVSASTNDSSDKTTGLNDKGLLEIHPASIAHNYQKKSQIVATEAIASTKNLNEIKEEAGASSPPSVLYNDAVAGEKAAESPSEDKREMSSKKIASTAENKLITDESAQAQSARYSKQESVATLPMQKGKNAEEKRDLNGNLEDVQQKINKENFKDALDELKIILKHNSDDVNALYNAGLVYYKMNENVEALQYFDKTMNNPDKKLFEDARWYKVLTYVKMNDKLNARKIISQIIAEKSIYKSRAEDLLEIMDGN